MSFSAQETIRHPYCNVNLLIHLTVADLYQLTPFGCHGATLGNISVMCQDVVPSNGNGAWNEQSSNSAQVATKRHPLTPYVIVDYLQRKLTGGYSLFGQMQHKSHIIISANYNIGNYHTYDTKDVMEMILAMCKAMPDKFGCCAVTEESKNMGHGTDGSRIKTIVWVPGYVKRDVQKLNNADWTINPAFEEYARNANLFPLLPTLPEVAAA